MTAEELYALHNPTVRPLLRAARELVASVWPDAVERFLKDTTIRYGIGPRMSDEVIYIAGFTSHANLGFVQGAHLPNPHGLLEGTGKGMRHVKLRSPEDLNRPGMRELVQSAVDHATAQR